MLSYDLSHLQKYAPQPSIKLHKIVTNKMTKNKIINLKHN